MKVFRKMMGRCIRVFQSSLKLSLELATFHYVTFFCHVPWVNPVQTRCENPLVSGGPGGGGSVRAQGGKESMAVIFAVVTTVFLTNIQIKLGSC